MKIENNKNMLFGINEPPSHIKKKSMTETSCCVIRLNVTRKHPMMSIRQHKLSTKTEKLSIFGGFNLESHFTRENFIELPCKKYASIVSHMKNTKKYIYNELESHPNQPKFIFCLVDTNVRDLYFIFVNVHSVGIWFCLL